MSGGWWFRLDGEFVENQKVMDLTDRAFRLHVAGLCYSTRNLTDGFLSERAVKVVCALTAATRKHLVELRDAGLWNAHDDGFAINDYLEHNPSSVEVKGLRDKRREAGRKGGLNSGAKRRKQNEASASATARAKHPPNRSKHGTEQEEPKAVTSLQEHTRAKPATNGPGFQIPDILVREIPA